jgi:hypothetical protein
MVANPETAEAISVADKKAEILPAMAQKDKDDSTAEADSDAEAKPAVVSSSEPTQTPGVKKSPLKLAVGLIVGLVENIFSSNKKR